MARGRRNSKREAAGARQLAALEHAQYELLAADERAATDRRLTRKWRDTRAGLDRLGALSRDLEKLHHEEARLLRERDELVTWLRGRGQSWVALTSRTKLSRQALMKRTSLPGKSNSKRPGRGTEAPST